MEVSYGKSYGSQARARLAEATAAIAAAEKSAMNAYALGNFRAEAAPVAPWVASPIKGDNNTFADRLRKHEAHLNSIKNALPFEQASPRACNTSAPDSHVQGNKPINHLQLPPWSQPAQLPSFSSFQKSDSIASKASLEGSSRVSTAGSGATIGWAGPWVVTHVAGGPDRMYPAHMRSNKPSGRLQAATKTVQNPPSSQHPQTDATAASQAAQSHQAISDVSWNLPPRNPAPAQHHKPTAACPDNPNETHAKSYGALAPSKHASPQQSRIPSPTKSIPKGQASSVSPTVYESLQKGRFRQAPDASQSRHGYQLQTDNRKHLAGTGYPSEGPGSLARSVKEKKEMSAEMNLTSHKPTALSGVQKHVSKQQAPLRKSSQRPGKPAWVGSAEETDQQTQAEPSATTFGKHAAGDADNSAVLRRHNQQHTQQDVYPTYSSGTSEGYSTDAAAMQNRAGRLQALQRLHGVSAQDEALQNYPRGQQLSESQDAHAHHAREGKGNAGKGLSESFGAAMQMHDETSSKALRAGALRHLKDASGLNHEIQEPSQDAARGRSSTPIDRLRRLQRTRSTQPRIEGMPSSPNSIPTSHTTSSHNTNVPVSNESSQRFCNAGKKLAQADQGSRGAKTSQRQQAYGTRNENHPGDSNSRNHATRVLHAANSTQHGAASVGKSSFSNGSKASAGRVRIPPVSASETPSPAAARFGGAKRAAQAHGAEARLGGRSKDLEDIPVGPGRSGAGIDFEKLIEQKLQEEGEPPMGAAVTSELHQCGSCGRQFAATALERHRAVCAKVFASKRKPMDMSQQRMAGMEGASGGMSQGVSYGKVGKSKGGRSRGAAGRSGAVGSKGAAMAPVGDERSATAGGVSRAGKWKQQSQQLRSAMNGNKVIQQAEQRGEDISKLPLYEDSVPDDRVPCPHCNRKFAALTAERHIPKCKDIRAKPTFLKRGSGNAGGNLARFKPSR